jgi:glycosyltransferase involved in cell wall biosynthesis
MADEYQVAEYIAFHGACSPERVREIMEYSHIFAFTSDHREGWGAVLNEAMNSGLAVVASTAPGATRYLIEDGKNGYHIDSGYQGLKNMVEDLLEDAERREEIGRNAYHTITTLWNAEHAVSELIRICQEVLSGREITPAERGPLSIAPKL